MKRTRAPRRRFGISLRFSFLVMTLTLPVARLHAEDGVTRTIELPAAELRDRIRGGLLGQILGNLNGIPHEMKYIAEPGDVEEYTPALPEGARTDDDTDFEWVYVAEMQRQDTVLLPPERIAELWKTRINRRIWCSNQYARQLMDLGLEPPLTGRFALNPWADNTAATAGTVVGVTKGYRWMMSQGWQIVDRYRNTTRENMPEDETITSFADRLIDLAERVIVDRGGERVRVDGELRYRIPAEAPRNVLPLPSLEEQTGAMRRTLQTRIEAGIAGDGGARERARAAYLAICLDLASELRERHPEGWRQALAALESQWNVVQALFHHADVPAGEGLRRKAEAAGLERPAEARPLW